LQKETREEALARIALGLAKTAERRRKRGLNHPADLVWSALLFFFLICKHPYYLVDCSAER
jgi:hypothetical protein